MSALANALSLVALLRLAPAGEVRCRSGQSVRRPARALRAVRGADVRGLCQLRHAAASGRPRSRVPARAARAARASAARAGRGGRGAEGAAARQGCRRRGGPRVAAAVPAGGADRERGPSDAAGGRGQRGGQRRARAGPVPRQRGGARGARRCQGARARPAPRGCCVRAAGAAGRRETERKTETETGTETERERGIHAGARQVGNMVVLVPWVEGLFFRAFLPEALGGGAPALPAAGLLWACYHMHYKGEFLLRFALALALAALAPAPLAPVRPCPPRRAQPSPCTPRRALLSPAQPHRALRAPGARAHARAAAAAAAAGVRAGGVGGGARGAEPGGGAGRGAYAAVAPLGHLAARRDVSRTKPSVSRTKPPVSRTKPPARVSRCMQASPPRARVGSPRVHSFISHPPPKANTILPRRARHKANTILPRRARHPPRALTRGSRRAGAWA
jgi:hypothetical protein